MNRIVYVVVLFLSDKTAIVNIVTRDCAHERNFGVPEIYYYKVDNGLYCVSLPPHTSLLVHEPKQSHEPKQILLLSLPRVVQDQAAAAVPR